MYDKEIKEIKDKKVKEKKGRKEKFSLKKHFPQVSRSTIYNLITFSLYSFMLHIVNHKM